MTDLAEWLLAAIEDDERVARAAVGDPTFNGTGIITGDIRHPAQVLLSGTARHIARWDPARVLAECDAKRRIIARHSDSDFRYDPDDGPGDYSWTPTCDHCGREYPCPDLRDLALAYASRDGYQAEWAP